jgi:hypothetical protein
MGTEYSPNLKFPIKSVYSLPGTIICASKNGFQKVSGSGTLHIFPKQEWLLWTFSRKTAINRSLFLNSVTVFALGKHYGFTVDPG